MLFAWPTDANTALHNLPCLVQRLATLGWLHRHHRPEELYISLSPLTGYSQVDSLGLQYKSDAFDLKKSPLSPNWRDQFRLRLSEDSDLGFP